jgi:hypothetical protein
MVLGVGYADSRKGATSRSSGGGQFDWLWLENAAGAAHIPQVTQDTRTKLLEKA